MAERLDLAGEALRRVDVEMDRRPVQFTRDLLNRLHGSGFVVDVHQAHEQGVRAHRRHDPLDRDDAVAVGRHQRHAEAAALELGDRSEHGMVFDGRRDDVAGAAGAPGQAQDCEVVAFGRATRENDVAARRAGDGRDLVARVLDGGAGPLTPCVRAAAGVAELVIQEWLHGGADRGIQRGRRRAVQVDGSLRLVMEQSREDTSLSPTEHLARDWRIFQAVESGAAGVRWSIWEARRPVVVLGRGNRVDDWVAVRACRRDGIDVLRRCSGGGAVVLGPGCLNYAIGLSIVSRPGLAEVAASFRTVLACLIAELQVEGLMVAGLADLALEGRKVSG